MKTKKSINIGRLTSFGIDAIAKEYIQIVDRNEFTKVCAYLSNKTFPYYILGGGSNTIFLKYFDGLVIQINTKGIEKIEETSSYIKVKVQAGENWDDLVKWSVNNSLYGIENLAAIPGTVGASPIQNIGAYGVEVKDTIESVECMEISSGNIFYLDYINCKFDYRDSIFKKELKNKVIVLSVNFTLSKIKKLNLNYSDVQEELKGLEINSIDSQIVYNSIRKIRERKLPNPEIIGNSGSFFKNPVIDDIIFQKLTKEFSEIKYFKQQDDSYKLAAAWMIEYCGWKGRMHKGCKVHENQALVLTNYKNATSEDLMEIIQMIQHDVFSEFGIKLEAEVNLIK